jgi:hypothetical protein
MTAAYLKTRSRSSLQKGRTIAQAHPYAVAAAANAGALAISAFVNRHLANPPAGQFLEVNGPPSDCYRYSHVCDQRSGGGYGNNE